MCALYVVYVLLIYFQSLYSILFLHIFYHREFTGIHQEIKQKEIY